MSWFESLIIGLRGLMVHKGRAALSMLGIIFGVAAVTAAVSVSLGAEREFRRLLAAMGSNTIVVDWTVDKTVGKDNPASLRGRGLSLRDIRALAGLPHVVAAAPINYLRRPGRQRPASVRAGLKSAEARVLGTTPEYIEIMGFQVQDGGRFISHLDDRDVRRVCVLEQTLAERLFPPGGARGALVFLEGRPYRVLGVLREKVTSGEKKFEDVVDIKAINRSMYVPLSCTLRRTTRRKLGGEINGAVLRVDRSAHLKRTAALIARTLSAHHDLDAWAPPAPTARSGGGPQEAKPPFQVRIPLELLEQRQASQKLFNLILYVTALTSLMVGGIGIMNIMLANVSERRREIGIRRAVGATERDIRRQFLLEAISICMLGGAVGLGLGIGLSFLIQERAGFSTALSFWGMAASFGTAAVTGLVFGTVPAFRAARLDPIEALGFK